MSLVFLVHPGADIRAAVPPVPPKTDKQKPAATTTATKTGKKTPPPVAATAKTGQQPARQKPLAAKIPATAPAKPKPQQVTSRPGPVKQDASAVGRTGKAKQRPAATAIAETKPTAPSLPTTTTRKKKIPAAADHAVANTLPEIDKQISSRSAIVMDAHTGEELFTKYPDNPRQPASTIKIVTAMIALKSLKNDDVIDVSDHAAGMPSSKIFLEPSKHYRANDLINAVLLASANDASVALAEKIAGSEDNFANLMTLSARMWGARNTVCRTASGLTALGQQSTARDLANLFRYAMQHDEFAHRMQEKFISTSYGKVLRNHNKALWRLDGAVGGKTGYTVAARQTYVGQFSRDNQTIVVAIMGSETMWADLAKLVEYGFRKKKEEQLARIGSDGANRTTRIN